MKALFIAVLAAVRRVHPSAARRPTDAPPPDLLHNVKVLDEID